MNIKLIILILGFMSISLVGGSSGKEQVTKDTDTSEKLYKERIQNINRLEQMKYVVHKMAQ